MSQYMILSVPLNKMSALYVLAYNLTLSFQGPFVFNHYHNGIHFQQQSSEVYLIILCKLLIAQDC